MANTPVYSLPYPTNNDGPYGPAQIQALAEAVEGQVQRVDGRFGTWVNFSPAVYTNMLGTPTTISRTVEYARYRRIDSLVIAHAAVVCNATTSGGVGIDLPVPAAYRHHVIGGLVLTGSGTLPEDQSGVAWMYTDLAKVVLVGYTQGYRNVGAAGQILRYSVVYEAA